MSLDMTYYNEMEAKIPNGKVRTRFAPSPTGYMHVGNLRTALYTWLIARNNGGTFILRIEDTDQGRLVEGATDVIYRTMAECGLTHDEGPDVGGPTGPYIQSQRRDLYLPYAQLLVERGAQIAHVHIAGGGGGKAGAHFTVRDLCLHRVKISFIDSHRRPPW